MRKLISSCLLILLSCGPQEQAKRDPEVSKSPKDQLVEDLQKQLFALQGTITNINNMVLSDFNSCSGTNAADALINKICKVAQASTVESKVAMKSELQTFSTTLEEKVSYINRDLASVLNNLEGVSLSTIQSDITTINSTLTTLDTRLDDAESAIDALETLTASISGSLNGTVKEIQVGNENLSAGPAYESLLKRVDHDAISAYVEAYATAVTIASNGLDTTSGSAIITVTTSAVHGLAVNERVFIQGVESGKGWAASEVNGEFTVVTVPTTTTFTITMSRNSTKTGTFGGANGTTKEVLGRGLGRIWATGDGDDVAVRVANPRGKPYNFIIVENGSGDGYVCYDKSNPSANFATLSGAGCQTDGVAAGTCACK
jgi:hypothetical protein